MEALAQRSPDASEHRVDEPYRRALTGIYAPPGGIAQRPDGRRGRAPCRGTPECLRQREEFLADLRVIEASLKSHHGEAWHRAVRTR